MSGGLFLIGSARAQVQVFPSGVQDLQHIQEFFDASNSLMGVYIKEVAHEKGCCLLCVVPNELPELYERRCAGVCVFVKCYGWVV